MNVVLGVVQSAAKVAIFSGTCAIDEACSRTIGDFASMLPKLASAPFLFINGDLVTDREFLLEDDANEDEKNGILISAARIIKTAMRADDVTLLRKCERVDVGRVFMKVLLETDSLHSSWQLMFWERRVCTRMKLSRQGKSDSSCEPILMTLIRSQHQKVRLGICSTSCARLDGSTQEIKFRAVSLEYDENRCGLAAKRGRCVIDDL